MVAIVSDGVGGGGEGDDLVVIIGRLRDVCSVI